MNLIAQKIDLLPIEGFSGGYQNSPVDVTTTLSTAEKIISNTIGFFTVIAGLTFTVYVVLAGLTWITAREQSDRISKSKDMLMNAFVGLAIVVVSWALVGVLENIFGLKILHPAELIKTMYPK